MVKAISIKTNINRCVKGVRAMVSNTTFNNISVISRLPVEYPKKITDLPQVIDNFYHILMYLVHLTSAGFELTTLVLIGTIEIKK